MPRVFTSCRESGMAAAFAPLRAAGTCMAEPQGRSPLLCKGAGRPVGGPGRRVDGDARRSRQWTVFRTACTGAFGHPNASQRRAAHPLPQLSARRPKDCSWAFQKRAAAWIGARRHVRRGAAEPPAPRHPVDTLPGGLSTNLRRTRAARLQPLRKSLLGLFQKVSESTFCTRGRRWEDGASPARPTI